MQQTSAVNKQKPCGRVAETVLAWIVFVTGLAGLFLRILPGGILIVLGGVLLNRRYSWLRSVINKYRQRFPALHGALSNGQRRKQQTVQGSQASCVCYKVLIFDRDIQQLARYAEPSGARGVEFHKCTSIESAMRCVEREEFDLALIDQVSPAFEGRRVIKHLVRYNWPLPFIVLAQPEDKQCMKEALEIGAAEYLEKPVSEEKWV
jgi:CheY-like chemotaxis protein